MRIGLLLGSFDPFHIGHLSLAMKAVNSKTVTEVWVVPAYQNPWKDTSKASFIDRFNLTDLGCEGVNEYIFPIMDELWDHEDLDYSTYSVIDKIKINNPEHEFYIITSIESFNTIQYWKMGACLLTENHFIVISRSTEIIDLLSVSKCITISILESDVSINTSSTKIRKMLNTKTNPIPYLSIPQYNYIKSNNLYEEF